MYGEYSLAGIPHNALPQKDRVHKGKHSYSVHKGDKIVEVLLRSQAFFVRDGPKKGRYVLKAYQPMGLFQIYRKHLCMLHIYYGSETFPHPM